jgi:hypothetical protein
LQIFLAQLDAANVGRQQTTQNRQKGLNKCSSSWGTITCPPTTRLSSSSPYLLAAHDLDDSSRSCHEHFWFDEVTLSFFFFSLLSFSFRAGADQGLKSV